jgi:hypothetical protein
MITIYTININYNRYIVLIINYFKAQINAKEY